MGLWRQKFIHLITSSRQATSRWVYKPVRNWLHKILFPSPVSLPGNPISSSSIAKQGDSMKLTGTYESDAQILTFQQYLYLTQQYDIITCVTIEWLLEIICINDWSLQAMLQIKIRQVQYCSCASIL